MEHWEDHGFAPTGPLENNKTHVDVYENNNVTEWSKRAQKLKPPHYPRIDRRPTVGGKAQRKEMRSDPMYQFVMMVASFANLRLNQM